MISRILIVNDSRIERATTKQLLSKDYMVFEAENSDMAFDVLSSETIDLILMDNLLKDETGYEITKKIRHDKRYEHIPVVLMSSNDNPIDEMKAFESGFNAYLQKQHIKDEIHTLILSFQKKELTKQITALIVDDEKIIRNLLKYTFEKEGFSVKCANSGETAVELLKEFRPDFITMDAEMPGIDGFQTAKMIRSYPETTDIPIIMITSLNNPESQIKSFESGIMDYFTKPFQPAELVKHIKKNILNML